MGGSQGAGGGRPLRAAGVALLGIAAITALIALVGSLGGRPENSAAVSRARSAPSATSPAATPTDQGHPRRIRASAAADQPAPEPSPELRAPLRVYNNSAIRNLAAHAADDFRSAGWRVTTVGNYSRGIIPTSTVYYQRGSGLERAATTLAREFSLRVKPRFPGIRDASPGLIVILTRDYSKA